MSAASGTTRVVTAVRISGPPCQLLPASRRLRLSEQEHAASLGTARGMLPQQRQAAISRKGGGDQASARYLSPPQLHCPVTWRRSNGSLILIFFGRRQQTVSQWPVCAAQG